MSNNKKGWHRRIDSFELWCWRRLLRVLWTARRSNQSILKEFSPDYSLEGLMLKLKFQCLRVAWKYMHAAPAAARLLQSCPTLCDPMDCSMPGFPVHHQLQEFSETHVRQVSDAIQPFHPLSFPSPLALNFSQHQDHLQWLSFSYQVAKVLELQLHHQSFQWMFVIDFL